MYTVYLSVYKVYSVKTMQGLLMLFYMTNLNCFRI